MAVPRRPPYRNAIHIIMASKPRRTDPAGLGLLEYDEGLKALLIGCTYKDHPSLDSLPGTERDVRGMEAALREVHFEDVQTLLNEQVTKAAIEQALSGFMVGKEATNGCLYVMLAGHGVLDNAGRSVFCCHDYSEANAFMTSIPLDTVKNMAARIVIKHQVYHLDCCHAGGMGKHRGIDNAWAWSQARKPAILGMTAVTADEKAIEESGSNGHGLFTASTSATSRSTRPNGWRHLSTRRPGRPRRRRVSGEVARKDRTTRYCGRSGRFQRTSTASWTRCWRRLRRFPAREMGLLDERQRDNRVGRVVPAGHRGAFLEPGRGGVRVLRRRELHGALLHGPSRRVADAVDGPPSCKSLKNHRFGGECGVLTPRCTGG